MLWYPRICVYEYSLTPYNAHDVDARTSLRLSCMCTREYILWHPTIYCMYEYILGCPEHFLMNILLHPTIRMQKKRVRLSCMCTYEYILVHPALFIYDYTLTPYNPHDLDSSTPLRLCCACTYEYILWHPTIFIYEYALTPYNTHEIDAWTLVWLPCTCSYKCTMTLYNIHLWIYSDTLQNILWLPTTLMEKTCEHLFKYLVRFPINVPGVPTVFTFWIHPDTLQHSWKRRAMFDHLERLPVNVPRHPTIFTCKYTLTPYNTLFRAKKTRDIRVSCMLMFKCTKIPYNIYL